MPTYDYLCDGCGHRFEKMQNITSEALKDCPECKESVLRRLIGGGGAVIFKGSGFYETDYRSDSYKHAAKTETSAAAADSSVTTGSDSSKSDSSKSDSSKSETKSTSSKPDTAAKKRQTVAGSKT